MRNMTAVETVSHQSRLRGNMGAFYENVLEARLSDDPSGIYVMTPAFLKNNPWWPSPWREAYGPREEDPCWNDAQ